MSLSSGPTGGSTFSSPSYNGLQVRNRSSARQVKLEMSAYIESIKSQGGNVSKKRPIASPAVIIAPEGHDAKDFAIQLRQSD